MRIVDAWHNKDRTRTARYGKGLRWQVVYNDHAGGPDRRKSFPTKDAAQAFLNRVQAERHSGGVQHDSRLLFSEWVTEWRERQIHQRNGSLELLDSKLKKHILPAFEGMALAAIRRRDVQAAVVAWQAAGLAPRTIEPVYAFLSQIFREAVVEKLIRESPCVQINLPEVVAKRVVPMSSEQVQILTDVMIGYLQPAVVFAAATGLRPGEWRGLTADRVDLRRGVVTVDRQLVGSAGSLNFGPTKTPWSNREVKIGDSTKKLLEPLVAEPGEWGLLFTDAARKPMYRQQLSTRWRVARDLVPARCEALEAAAFNPGRGWHQLRHHHASLLIAGGASPVAVAHRLGHKDATETLQTYAHLWATDDDRLAGMSDGLVTLNRHESDTEALVA